MSALTDNAEVLLLNYAFTTGAVTRPVDWEVSLHTADPTEAGTTAEVLVGNDADYVRKAVTFGGLSGSSLFSQEQLTWTPAVGATAYEVTHIAVWDRTNAVPLMKGALLVPRTIDNSNPLVIAAGDIVIALD